jgi:hypothetical protein
MSRRPSPFSYVKRVVVSSSRPGQLCKIRRQSRRGQHGSTSQPVAVAWRPGPELQPPLPWGGLTLKADLDLDAGSRGRRQHAMAPRDPVRCQPFLQAGRRVSGFELPESRNGQSTKRAKGLPRDAKRTCREPRRVTLYLRNAGLTPGGSECQAWPLTACA